MWRSSKATIDRPLVSKRLITAPARQRRIASGLIRTKERCAGAAVAGAVMAGTLPSGSEEALALRSLRGVQPLAEHEGEYPETGEHRADEDHRGGKDAEGQPGELGEPAQRVASRLAERSG